MLAEERGGLRRVNRSMTLDWEALRQKSLVTACAIQLRGNCTYRDHFNIIGVDACIEPCFGNLSVRINLSGEFTVINHYLVRDLKQLGCGTT
jgi:ribonucleoside-diphosphate reductase alpha chain